jgi:pseudouridine-5'-phosphate glycosidase
MATGGIGGVHRDPRDVSPDVEQLARTQVVVVSSGAKSLLDVPATAELLETLGVPVLGYATDELPLFYTARGGPNVSARVDSPDEAAAIARRHWELGGAGVLLARPPTNSLDDVEPLITTALDQAAGADITGARLTPFVLAYLHEHSDGRTLAANRELVLDNASLAAAVAAALT